MTLNQEALYPTSDASEETTIIGKAILYVTWVNSKQRSKQINKEVYK